MIKYKIVFLSNDEYNNKKGNEMINIENYSIEDLAHALYIKMENLGYEKGTDKTKWREQVVADLLNHKAHEKISAGKNSEKYGSDAYDSKNDKYSEYKSTALNDKKIKNLLQESKNNKGAKYSPLTIKGVYNSAYTDEAIEKFVNIDHYFSVFYKEKCILIIKVKTEEVIRQLKRGHEKMLKKGGTTNCNAVQINLSDTHLYEVMYKNYSIMEMKK